MINLALDTSTNFILLALFQESRLIASLEIEHENTLSKILLPSIEKLLSSHGYQPSDIGHIFVGIGPGSYTGKWIAVATASALALARKVPVHPFYSPLAFLPKELPDGPFTFIIEAKHTPNFFLQGILSQGKIETILSHSFSPPLHESSRISFIDSSCYLARPHLLRLISYLNTIACLAPAPPKILYLHTP